MNTQLLIAKEEKLQQIAQELKMNFVGVDLVIDKLIQQITPWYLTPSLLDKPMIINLWGMTGVGKTDLVRQLVSLLDFQDRFLEVELSHNRNSAYSGYENSLVNLLHSNQILDEEPKILLFDEMQHFRSIDQDGREVTNRRYQDFWELLSDGKLLRRNLLDEFEDVYLEMTQDMTRRNEQKAKEGDDAPLQSFIHSPWTMRKLRRFISNEHRNRDSKTLARLSPEEILMLLEEIQANKKLYAPLHMSQSLIIVSGNLDALYSMSGLSSETEIDATIFHEQTKKLTIVSVKKCLQKYFRPEEISRLGNTHIIYPSLSKDNFQTLIRQRLGQLQKKVLRQTGITLFFDESVFKLIYRNGVFPTQGVRPVFSAISEIITTRLAGWLLYCAKHTAKELEIAYSQDSSEFQVVIPHLNTPLVLESFSGNLDSARSGKSKDEQAVTAVHESGHALLYATCFGLAPLQIKSKLANIDSNGFTFPHSIELSAENIFLQIQILTAGALAEELIYGKKHISAGHAKDLQHATELAARAVRELGFSELYGKFTTLFSNNAQDARTDIDASNELIENILLRAKERAMEILVAQKQCLITLSKALAESGMLEPEDFITNLKDYGIPCKAKPEGWVVIHNYAENLQNMV